jgi:hypothetical protein
MNSESLHKILEPYLWASALMVAILLITVYLLKRDGEKQREAEARRPAPPAKPKAARKKIADA